MLQNAKVIGIVLSGVVIVVALTAVFPGIWDTKRSEHLDQALTAAEKLSRLRSCLKDAGLIEGVPDGDFYLKPTMETVDGVETVKSFFVMIPDEVLKNEQKMLTINACKNMKSASR